MRHILVLISLCLAAPAPAQEDAPFPLRVKTGIDVMAETGFWDIQGKKVGLITNQTGKNRHGMSTADILAGMPGVTLSAIFSPEHGFKGQSEEFRVGSDTLKNAGKDIPVISLYSGGLAGMRPKRENLKNLDALIFDIQDIGARFYTYLTTMGMALEEAAKAGIPFIVLDRPNPINGLTMEGPVLEDLSLRQVTATAYFPVPIRHGMTAGEIALFHNETVRHPNLQIVKMSGWTREMWYNETGLPWTPPSPNMPTLGAAALYPGIGCFEASNISVGRGTPWPFRWIGAPWMDAQAVVDRLKKANLAGIEFSVEEHTPTKSVFEGVACQGVRMKVLNPEALRPLEVFLHLAAALRDRHPGQFKWKWDEALKMTGTEGFRKLYESKVSAEEIIKVFNRGPKQFAETRKPFLLY